MSEAERIYQPVEQTDKQLAHQVFQDISSCRWHDHQRPFTIGQIGCKL